MMTRPRRAVRREAGGTALGEELWLVPLNGGGARKLDGIESLNWTPDGAALLVGAAREMTNAAYGEFWLVPVDGGEARKLDSLDGSDSRLARLHPNGRRLALVTGENRGEIWALQLGAGEVAARGSSP